MEITAHDVRTNLLVKSSREIQHGEFASIYQAPFISRNVCIHQFLSKVLDDSLGPSTFENLTDIKECTISLRIYFIVASQVNEPALSFIGSIVTKVNSTALAIRQTLDSVLDPGYHFLYRGSRISHRITESITAANSLAPAFFIIPARSSHTTTNVKLFLKVLRIVEANIIIVGSQI